MAKKILRRSEVEARFGVSRSTIYAWMASGDFPRPVRLGPRAVGWLETDIERWLHTRNGTGWAAK